jgi:hypothetical protein
VSRDYRKTWQREISLDSMEVCVTDTADTHIDPHLAGTRLRFR